MSNLFSNYVRQPKEMVKGQGNYLMDNQGKKYLDLTSGIGVMSLGYSNKAVEQAVKRQLNLLWHTPNLYENTLQERVAKKLIGERDYLAFFCNSGAEANEAAIKLARKSSGKAKIITLENSFHGRTYGAMSATGQASIQAGFGPLVPEFETVPVEDISALEQAVDSDTAAVMIEVIQGEGGVFPISKEWCTQVQELCAQTGTLLIVDEIQSGIGRTGFLYAYEAYGLSPDIITLAKALGSGIPVGAMLGKRALAGSFGPGSHGSTFGGNKIAMAAAEAVLSEIQSAGFLEEVKAKGAYFMENLEDRLLPLSQVFEVRGLGFMIGIELTIPIAGVVDKLAEHGVLALTAKHQVLRLLPPLTLTYAEIDQAVNVIYQVLVEEAEGME